jgi:hypothetical protein
MMAQLPEKTSVIIDGVEVGQIEAKTGELPPRGEITLNLTFRPNWPGIWHMQALALDAE